MVGGWLGVGGSCNCFFAQLIDEWGPLIQTHVETRGFGDPTNGFEWQWACDWEMSVVEDVDLRAQQKSGCPGWCNKSQWH